MSSRATARFLRRTSIAALLLVATFVGSAPGAARAAAPAPSQTHRFEIPVREHIFDNGLRLLVLERPGDQRVACKIFTDFGEV